METIEKIVIEPKKVWVEAELKEVTIKGGTDHSIPVESGLYHS